MTTLAVRHRVRDYDSWKPIFDEHEAVRRQHGSAGHRLYRMADNPNDLAISIEFPSADAAQAFLEDPSLRETMERAGVEGEPQLAILEQVETRSYEPAVA
jgi:quinol monooxygenase YgiN